VSQGSSKPTVTVDDIYAALKIMIGLISNPGTADGNGRVRMLIDSINSSITMPISGTLTAVTSITQLGGYAIKPSFMDSLDTIAFAQSVRPRIS
jgi:hypothetical protein